MKMYTLTVDYRKTVNELIRRCRFLKVDPALFKFSVEEANCCSRCIGHTVLCELIHPGRNSTTEEIIAEFRRRRLMRPTLIESLTALIQRQEFGRDFPVVFLVDVPWLSRGELYVPYASTPAYDRYLDAEDLKSLWGPLERFFAVSSRT